MRIALLSDIHGKALELKAVLREVGQRGVDRVLNRGDIFYGPPWPRTTCDLLRPLSAIPICGNPDREPIEAMPSSVARDPTVRFDLDERDGEPMPWLRQLPGTARVGSVLAVHGTPDSELEYLQEDIGSGRGKLRCESDILTHLGPASEAVIVCGHTHTPRQRTLSSGCRIVNPGSVGLPAYDDEWPTAHGMQTGSPDARWALIERRTDGGCAERNRVCYDHEVAARQTESPQPPDWAVWLRSGVATVPAGPVR